jgi:hypothetical protein
MGISWWRMAFIFGPAVARGDISSFSLYTPFIFGEPRTRLARSGERGGPASRAWPRACHRVAPRSPFLATRGAGRRHVPCRRGARAGVCRLLCLAVNVLLTRLGCSLPSPMPLPRGVQTPAAGHLLSRTVRKWKDKVKLRGWPHKVRGPALRPRGAESCSVYGCRSFHAYTYAVVFAPTRHIYTIFSNIAAR